MQNKPNMCTKVFCDKTIASRHKHLIYYTRNNLKSMVFSIRPTQHTNTKKRSQTEIFPPLSESKYQKYREWVCIVRSIMQLRVRTYV